MVVGIFLLVSVSQCLSGERINARDAALKEVLAGNDSRGSRGKMRAREEFYCEEIHNLTMMGFAGDAKSPPSTAVDESLDALLKDFDDSPDRKNDDAGGREKNILKALQLKIQHQIEDRIKNLEQEPGREARSSHLGFPSMESALVSISLLLFAVYLIKLVMKLMYAFHFKKGATEVVGLLSNVRQPLILDQSRRERTFDREMEGWEMRDVIERQRHRFN